jgi:hypothetical protein
MGDNEKISVQQWPSLSRRNDPWRLLVNKIGEQQSGGNYAPKVFTRRRRHDDETLIGTSSGHGKPSGYYGARPLE